MSTLYSYQGHLAPEVQLVLNVVVGMKCAAPARRWIWQSFTAFDRHVMATVKSATSHTRLLEATRKISVRGGWACHCALRQPLAFVYSSAVQATPSDQSVPVSLQQVEDRMGALNTRPTVRIKLSCPMQRYLRFIVSTNAVGLPGQALARRLCQLVHLC